VTEGTAEIMGAERSHDTLHRVLASREPCKILDAACGQGVLALALRDRSFDVHCADIIPELFEVEGLPFKQVNLNRRLPYEDGEFDAVVCANAMHRLFNPAGAAREFHRILRPGGRVYINLNNYASIETRVRFLLYGSIERRTWEEGVDPLDDPEADVRIRIMFPQLAQYLQAAGFRIERVLPAPPRLRHRWLAPLAGLVWLVSRLLPEKERRDHCLEETNGRAILFGGYYVLVEAVRETEPADAPATS
jgi:SAM-dependent methyltransferase